MAYQSLNPYDGRILKTFEELTDQQLEAAVHAAEQCFKTWRHTTFAERSAVLARAAAILRSRAEDFARPITLEMGKLIEESRGEVALSADILDYYAENAARFLADEPAKTNAKRSIVAFEPLGIVLAVMPWNYPFWQVIRFAAPAFMAGNAAVLKHASNVPQSALAIEEAVRDAGFPEGLLRTLLLAGSAVEPLIADERIRAVTLTGSSATGSRIAELAGRALKKQVLELGGSDPFIVLDDADLAAA